MFMTGASADEVWPLIREFHYSKRMPGGIQHCYASRQSGGLFGDNGIVTAAAVFCMPSTKWSEDVIELSRLVRHPTHDQPLTKLLSFSCQWLKKSSWALVVSYADWTQGHHGGIYQASGWNYAGQRDKSMDGLMVDGIFKPGRSCNATWGTRSPSKLADRLPNHKIEPHYDEGKHLYWKVLTVAGKTKAKRLGLETLPYPKPNAARPVDEPMPMGQSAVQPCGAAPI